ncbi:MAG TPA: CBS domain-containing protein [Steroidobacteraceae bacterium]|nr:CBS domain-containing protein [Steroidobacteraceae bacterium]
MKQPTQIVAYMTPFPYSIDIEAPLAEARAFMQAKQIRHLPVTEEGRLAGIVTDRDVKLILGPDFAYPEERTLTVRDACAREPYIVEAGTALAEVAGTMARRHLGSAIIVKHGKLVGIFTSTDACRALESLLAASPPGPPEAA